MRGKNSLRRFEDMDLNSINIVGRLTKDCELSYTTGGTAVGKFSIACNRMKLKDNSVPVDYFDVELWGKQAEALKQYLVKGKQVAINGRIKQDRWQGQDGKSHSKVSIVADTVQLIGGVKADAPQGQYQQPPQYQQGGFPNDIPF